MIKRLYTVLLLAALPLVAQAQQVVVFTPHAAGAAVGTYSEELLNLSPTGYWKLDGDPNDASGNGNHLTNQGTPGAGSSLVDDGTASYDLVGSLTYAFGSTGNTLLGSTTASWVAWFEADDVTTRSVIFEAGGTSNGAVMHVEGGNLYCVRTISNATFAASSAVSTATIYHAACVYNGGAGTLTLYVNGSQEDQATSVTSSSNFGTVDAGIGGVRAGANMQDGTDVTGDGGDIFDGRIDDVSTHTTALTAPQVSTLYSAGS